MGMKVGKVTENISVLEKRLNNNVQGTNENLPELLSNPAQKTSPKEPPKEPPKIPAGLDKSKNGKFDISEALLNFGKGLISPVSVLIKHPIESIVALGLTVSACSIIPVLTPILATVFSGVSLYQIGKGTKNAVEDYNSGRYDDAEKSFDTIGQGVIGTLLSAFGLKPAAKISREAKLLAKGEKITPENASKLTKSGFFTNLKEILSLFTTKKGWKAIIHQFKLSSIKARFKEGFLSKIFRTEKGKTIKKETKVTRFLSKEEKLAKFKQTPEGIRRANMTEESIEQEISKMSEKIFDRLRIPKEQRPKIHISEEQEISLGGYYDSSSHEIVVNSTAYKSGLFDMEEILMHEATHCQKALLRASLPQKRVDEIVRKKLLEKARIGEAEEYPTGTGSILGADMEEVPKMSAQMRKDFYQIMKNPSEYKSLRGLKFYDEELVEELLSKYPEFVQQYNSKKEAYSALLKYMDSFEKRFNLYRNTTIKEEYLVPDETSYFGLRRETRKLNIPEGTGQTLQDAEQSLMDIIDTTEGNARVGGLNSFWAGKEGFNQYQFSPEEVLAEKNGQSYFIEILKARLKNPNISPEEQVRLQGLIDKGKAIIEYRSKGQVYYRKYVEHINNPENAGLADEVSKLEAELKELEPIVFAKEKVTETQTLEYDSYKILLNENVKAPLFWSYKFLEK